MREKERRKKNTKTSLYDLRDSVGPRTKVNCIDEGYAWVPKTRDFAMDPNEGFGK